MKKNVLITGGTGFLGSFLALELLKNSRANVFFLVRGKNKEICEYRIAEILKKTSQVGNINDLYADRINVLKGDVSKSNLGIDKDNFKCLIGKIDEVYHCAAITDFSYSMEIISAVNISGTQNVLEFAAVALKTGRPITVNLISTTYVVGVVDSKRIFFEDELVLNQQFNNSYEESKYRAELLADHYRRQGLMVRIFRTSILIGDTRHGIAINMRSFYQIVRVLSRGLFSRLPSDPNSLINFVPVDEAAKAIITISSKANSNFCTYHISHPYDITVETFVDAASLFFKFSKPNLIRLKEFDRNSLSSAQWNSIKPFLPYMNYHVSFDHSKSKKILDEENFVYSRIDNQLLSRIFKYCYESNFVKDQTLLETKS